MHDGSIRKVWSDAELDEALADLHSAPEKSAPEKHREPSVRQDELSRAKAALLRAAGEVDEELLPTSEPVRPAKKRPGSWRWIAAAAAAALVSGGVIVATNVFVGNDGQDTAAHPTVVSSDDALNDLRGADLPVSADQYYLVTESVWTTRFGKKSGVIYQTHEIHERWLSPNRREPNRTRFTRTGEIRWVKGDYQTAKSQGEQIPGVTVEDGWEGQSPPPTGGPASAPLTTSTSTRWGTPTTSTKTPEAPSSTQPKMPPLKSWLTPTKPFLTELPTDPAKLLETLRLDIRTSGREDSASELFDIATVLLRAAHGFGDLRVALCKALAMVPGVTLEKNVATPDNRPGISFSVALPDETKTFVADLATAYLARNRAVRNQPAPDRPALTIFDSTVTVQITDRSGPN